MKGIDPKDSFNKAYRYCLRAIRRIHSNTYKLRILASVGIVGMFATVSLAGNEYVKMNTSEVYHVVVGEVEAGIVSDPIVVGEFIGEKAQQVAQQNPDVHMELVEPKITYQTERAFKPVLDDQAVLRKIDALLTTKATGVELKVDGKLVAVVKDQATANQILDKIKNKFVPAQTSGEVMALGAAPDSGNDAVNQVKLESVQFMQQVDLTTVDIDPSEVTDPADVIKSIETGDVQPIKYEVKAGDCVSCIAKQFGIAKEVIYKNNPWIVDDLIRIGDILDLTVLQPTLTVQTVEQLVEEQEVQYDTIYELDPSMRVGQNQVLKAGVNGSKLVTFRVTKANGQMVEEELINEQIINAPIEAIVKKGTKVILGEGTGKFAWPVVGARITSSYGKRWGTLHKGIDMVSSKRTILAADNGVVEFAGQKSGYGNCIIIDHKNGFETLYGHLKEIDVKVGKIVEKGDKIGIMGNTGDSTGTHLHFEIHKSGSLQNPLKYLSQ